MRSTALCSVALAEQGLCPSSSATAAFASLLFLRGQPARTGDVHVARPGVMQRSGCIPTRGWQRAGASRRRNCDWVLEIVNIRQQDMENAWNDRLCLSRPEWRSTTIRCGCRSPMAAPSACVGLVSAVAECHCRGACRSVSVAVRPALGHARRRYSPRHSHRWAAANIRHTPPRLREPQQLRPPVPLHHLGRIPRPRHRRGGRRLPSGAELSPKPTSSPGSTSAGPASPSSPPSGRSPTRFASCRAFTKARPPARRSA